MACSLDLKAVKLHISLTGYHLVVLLSVAHTLFVPESVIVTVFCHADKGYN